MSRRKIIFIYFLLLVVIGCGKSKDSRKENPQDAVSILKAKHIAKEKAIELNYDVENMDISSNKQDSDIIIYLLPRQKAGVVTLGGDLMVIIDANKMEIKELKRGQ